MNRWQRRKLYARACDAYKKGLREGLASGGNRVLFGVSMWGDPCDHARTAGIKAGVAWDASKYTYATSPSPDLPDKVWAVVLAGALRP